MARRLLCAASMARLDTTAVWFLRGENEETLAETPLANGSEPRRLPTMAWVAGGVALAAALFGGVVLHIAHANAVVDEPLANPASAAATAPAAAPMTQPTPPVATPAVATPAVAAAPVAPAPTAAPVERGSEADKLLRRGKASAALAAYQQTLAQNPDDVHALRGACVALGKLGRMNDGARVCRRALDRAPNDDETRRALATIYYNGGAYKWSAAEWRRVLAHSPRDSRARRALQRAEARSDRG
jgi:tetratricopeptide (TPR) repeat protein